MAVTCCHIFNKIWELKVGVCFEYNYDDVDGSKPWKIGGGYFESVLMSINILHGFLWYHLCFKNTYVNVREVDNSPNITSQVPACRIDSNQVETNTREEKNVAKAAGRPIPRKTYVITYVKQSNVKDNNNHLQSERNTACFKAPKEE